MTAKRRSYEVIAEREPGWWIIRVPALDDVTTQARRLADVEPMVRDLIALWADVDPGTFDVHVTTRVPEAVAERIRQAKALLADAQAKQHEAGALATEAVSQLTRDLKMTLRDAGAVLGLSHQRVAQLSAKERRAS